MSKPLILSVDDNEDDQFLLRRAFSSTCADRVDLIILNDGEEAIGFLADLELEGEVSPHLLLLDLKMPRKDGFAVLDWVGRQPFLHDLRVAVFTSSQSSGDIARTYQQGADWYLVKPVALEDLCELADVVAKWAETSDPGVFAESRFFRPSPVESASAAALDERVSE